MPCRLFRSLESADGADLLCGKGVFYNVLGLIVLNAIAYVASSSRYAGRSGFGVFVLPRGLSFSPSCQREKVVFCIYLKIGGREGLEPFLLLDYGSGLG